MEETKHQIVSVQNLKEKICAPENSSFLCFLILITLLELVVQEVLISFHHFTSLFFISLILICFTFPCLSCLMHGGCEPVL